jgi:hypothetical protein
MPKTARILASHDAIALIQKLKKEFGDLVFHQSGGCCDGSSPMCFEKGDFKMGGSDVGIGKIEGVEFWMAKDQFEYWQHTQLTLDVVQGRGSSFSIEIPSGYRFIIRSRMYSEEESKNLDDLFFVVE